MDIYCLVHKTRTAKKHTLKIWKRGHEGVRPCSPMTEIVGKLES